MARVIQAVINPKYAAVSCASSGSNALVAAVPGKRLKLIACILVADGTVAVKFRSASTDLTGAMSLIVNSGFVIPESVVGWCVTAQGEALNLNLSAAIQVSGMLVYEEE